MENNQGFGPKLTYCDGENPGGGNEGLAVRGEDERENGE